MFRSSKDIVGKQFKHVELGSVSETLYKSDLKGLKDISTLIGILSGILANVPVSVASNIAALIFDRIIRNTPEELVVDTTSYEVLLTHDNAYYTHCYHSTIKFYNDGKLIKTMKDYSQSIGG